MADVCPWWRGGDLESSRPVRVEVDKGERPWRPLARPLLFWAVKSLPTGELAMELLELLEPLELLLLIDAGSGSDGVGAATGVAGARCVAFHFLTAAS